MMSGTQATRTTCVTLKSIPHQALFTEYHRGELSVAAAAAKVGFALPKVRSKGKGNPANKKKQSQETEGF